MKVAFLSLGCKVNQYETDCCTKLFRDKGYEISSFDETCDIYVVNTCSVTNIGDRKSRKMLRRAKKQNPASIVVAMGCYVQTKPDEVRKMPEVDLVIGTSHRSRIVELVEAALRGENTDKIYNIMQERLYEELECEAETERTRAYIKIQDGCDNFCSYCIIPYARGPVRSRKIENILKEADRLSQKGFTEVVLTGISVASYGKDLDCEISLKDVIDAVSTVSGITRIRLSSIDPRAFTDEFINYLANNKKVCRHFHISLQSGCDSVLKRMNRKYTTDYYLTMLSKIRSAMDDVSVTTDIICGFPEESEEEFLQTLAFVKKACFMKVHVFPYSQRSKTAAALMKQIDIPVRERRAKILSEAAECESEKFCLSYIGKELDVLFEQTDERYCEGLSGNYLRIYTKADDALTGKIRRVKITDMIDEKLIGTVI